LENILKSEIQLVINLNATEDQLTERIVARSKVTARPDDDPETVKNRIRLYNSTTVPTVQYYEKFNKVMQIDATKTVENVYQQIR